LEPQQFQYISRFSHNAILEDYVYFDLFWVLKCKL